MNHPLGQRSFFQRQDEKRHRKNLQHHPYKFLILFLYSGLIERRHDDAKHDTDH